MHFLKRLRKFHLRDDVTSGAVVVCVAVVVTIVAGVEYTIVGSDPRVVSPEQRETILVKTWRLSHSRF